MQQPIRGGTGEERLGEQTGKLVDVTVGGDDQGALLVPLTNDFIQV